MASHLLGIMGRKRSGKDTFAARLVAEHGFTRIAFADPLKAVARDLDPIVGADDWDGPYCYRLSEFLADHEDVDAWEAAKELPEVRRILQALGVAVRTHIGVDAWVDAAQQVMDDIPGPVVITDVRFPNEVRHVRLFGGKIVKVIRPGLPTTDLHISETALDDLVPDYAVGNGGTIADLHALADSIAERVLSAH